MTVTVLALPPLRLAALRHTGAYLDIGQAFAALDAIVRRSGVGGPNTMLAAVYYDDPAKTPAAALRSDAGVVLNDTDAVPEGLTEVHVPGGRFVCGVHVGPYARLPHAWNDIKMAFAVPGGLRRAEGPSYELYRNTPATAAPEHLITEICVPVL